MSINYHYLDAENREIGPVPVEALRALQAAGTLADSTLVRPESGGPWTPLANLIGPAPAPGGAAASPAWQIAKVALGDAQLAIKHLWANPAAGLPEAWRVLGSKRALGAGLAMLAGTAILFMALVYLSPRFFLIRPHDLTGFGKLLLVSCASLGVGAGAMIGAHKVLRSKAPWEGTVLVVGGLSLLWAVGLVAYVLVGADNFEAVAVVYTAVVCLNVLQIYIGLTQISGLREREATLAVPLVVLAGAWGAKIIFFAVYT